MQAMGASRPMRILVIAPTPFFADRGCHVRILGEAKAIQSLGHLLRICTYHIGKDVQGLDTVRTVNIPWYRKLSAGPSLHKLYIDLLLLWKVLRSCRQFSPDVLHAHLHEGIVIGKMASLLYRIPMVADLQGSLTEELLDHRFIPSWSWLIKAFRWIEKKINEMPQHLIASSFHTAQLVRERFGVQETKMTPIGDGVDLEIFYPRAADSSLKRELGIGEDDKIVVFLGVLTAYQGIDLLLEAMHQILRQVTKVKFLIIGYPEEGYRRKARSMGLETSAIFTGKIPYAETPRYLSLGSLAVSPKMSTTESNLKLFTYMAMGLPTVVFDSPINREILGELGVYAEYGNLTSFAASIIGLLRDECLAKELGDKCYQKALGSYSWLAVGHRLVGLYEQVCHG